MMLACIFSVLGGALLLPLLFILARADRAIVGFIFPSVVLEKIFDLFSGPSSIQNTSKGFRVIPLYGG
jgi:hypothetical protein